MARKDLITFNVDLGELILRQITDAPDTHSQSTFGTKYAINHPAYECGTSHCIAGWAAHFHAKKLHWSEFTGTDGFSTLLGATNSHGAYTNVYDYAQVALGLTDGQANALFWDMCDSTAAHTLAVWIEEAKKQQAA